MTTSTPPLGNFYGFIDFDAWKGMSIVLGPTASWSNWSESTPMLRIMRGKFSFYLVEVGNFLLTRSRRRNSQSEFVDLPFLMSRSLRLCCLH